jgi:Fungal specific transcription factor domain
MASRLFHSQSLHAVQGTHLLVCLSCVLVISRRFYCPCWGSTVLRTRFSVKRSGTSFAISTDRSLAYSIGLHRSSSIQRQDQLPWNKIEVEERRRTFWGLYNLDAIMSLMMGRPPIISESDIDAEFPLEHQDSLFTRETILPTQTGQQPYAHQAVRTLSQHFRNIYERLYSVKACKNRTQADLANTIRIVSGDMDEWRIVLRDGTKPFTAGGIPNSFAGISLEQVYNSIAFNLCQCLTYRPALIEATRPTDEWSYSHERRNPRRRASQERNLQTESLLSVLPGAVGESLEASADICVVAARDILNLIIRAAVYRNCHFSYVPVLSD